MAKHHSFTALIQPLDDEYMAEQSLMTSDMQNERTKPRGQFSRRWLLYTVPAIGFVGLAAVLAKGFNQDPKLVPSVLVGKQVPDFDLPPVKGRILGLSSKSLIGGVSLVNVFASWCVACREKHPLWMKLSTDKTVSIYGLNYKDAPDDAAQWFDKVGDPYTRTGADIDGRVGIDFGVYGVPETFVINREGMIAHKHIGAITVQALHDTILPLVDRLRKGPTGAGT